MRPDHAAVEVEIAVIQFAEAHGIPRLSAHLNIGAHHGLQGLETSRLGILEFHLLAWLGIEPG